jgi:Haem-binding domain
MKTTRSILGWLAGIVLIGLLIQLIPYGHDHSNPPVIQEPNWNSPQTRAITKRACFDCHSNETVWPWYSNIAPVSWFIYRDVFLGREHLNFSEWDVHPSLPQGEGEGEEHQHGPDVFQEVLESHEMPPRPYLLLHPEARLTNEEVLILIEGLKTSTQH